MLNPSSPTLQTIVRFRAASLRRSVFLAWLLIIGMVATGVAIVDRPSEDFDRLLLTAGAFVVLLSVGTALNWDDLMQRTIGPWIAWLWGILLTVGMGAMADITDLFDATVVLFAGVAVLTGLTLEPVRHAVVVALAVLALLLAKFDLVTDAAVTDRFELLVATLTNPVLTVLVVGVATGFLGVEFTREADRSYRRLEELNAQREDFERLYAVTATLAGADSLAEGLPQIVGTICDYLHAQVGVVFLYSPDDHTLKVMSPMYVNGHTLDVGDMKIPISTGGIVTQVFRSGKPILLERVSETPEQFGVIGELGLREAMVAPLRVEGYNVGAIAVGDPREGSFREDQIEVFASLAAPAALVLSQLGRYEAAAEMTRRMQEIAQMKTDFVSVVSHELRTPLTSIIGSLDTVNRPELSADLAKDLLDSARRQAGRLQRLIEDLLMVSRIDRGAIPVAVETVGLRHLLEEVADTVQGTDDITVSVQPLSLQVTGDPDHLRRVFINLVENAIKYAPGSPIELVARPFRDRVDVDVIDHGDGIPQHERFRVFEPFTQTERSDTRTRGGTGLGLSIVKGLTEAMNGRVTLSDTPGGGATFTVSLQPAGALLVSERA